MAKLIGTAPNQVPTNADLGTMAYQDKDVVRKEFEISRPNLVINGDFQVWQRSDNAYTGSNGYISVDRFKSTRGRIRKPNTNGNSGEDDRGCILDTTDGNVYVHFDYFIEDVGQKLAGKEAVMSFEAKAIGSSGFGLYMENSGVSGYGRLDTGGNNTPPVVNYEWRTIVLRGTITYDGSGEYFHLPRFYVNPTGGASSQNLQIDKLKVEIVEDGYKNPTPFVSKPYHEELAACQRYYREYGGEQPNERVAVGFYNSTSGFRTCVPLDPQMRVAPTLSVSADADWRVEHNGGSNTNTAHSLDQPSSKVASINVTTNKTGSGGDAGQLMASSTYARLKLDADI